MGALVCTGDEHPHRNPAGGGLRRITKGARGAACAIPAMRPRNALRTKTSRPKKTKARPSHKMAESAIKVTASQDEGYCIDSIDLLMLSDAKHRVSKHEGINTRIFQ
jgi:hypothetical protein